mgnify:CR=1 FL=1
MIKIHATRSYQSAIRTEKDSLVKIRVQEFPKPVTEEITNSIGNYFRLDINS